MSAHLGPRTADVVFVGGPCDGGTDTLNRSDRPMPVELCGYRLHHVRDDDGRRTWHYRWTPPHTGLRQPCRAGDERGCPGGRCPSRRQRQTT